MIDKKQAEDFKNVLLKFTYCKETDGIWSDISTSFVNIKKDESNFKLAKFEVDFLKKTNHKRFKPKSDFKLKKGYADYKFLNFNLGHDIATQIKLENKLSLKTIHTIICHFFFNLEIDLKNKPIDWSDLAPLVELFDLIEFESDRNKIIFTESLINHLTKVKKLTGISAAINKEWKLSFFYKKTKLFEQEEISKKESELRINPNSFENKNTIDKISRYFDDLKHEFKTIELNTIGFNIPSDKLIRLSLKKYNPIKEKQLSQLRKKLKIEPNNYNSIKPEILRLEKELKEEFFLENLINKNKNIFIKAPAGSGKSTLLQSITHTISSKNLPNTQEIIPVFIRFKELNNISEKDNFEDLILKNIRNFPVKSLKKLNMNLLLILDGFDEFKGDVSVLLKLIYSFVKIYNSQLIISGRFVPFFQDYNLPFQIYTICPLTKYSILKLSINILGKNRSFNLIEKIKSKDINLLIKRPLFLILCLAYLKDDNINLDSILSEDLLSNKGKIFKKVLLDQFILNYERKRVKNSKYWILDHAMYIEIVSYIAYYLTTIKGNSDIVLLYDLEKHLKKKYSLTEGKTRKIIDSFLSSNILIENNSGIDFEKEEFKYFFAANHLLKITNSKLDLLLFKYKSQNNKIPCDGAILDYFYGLVDPNKLLKDYKKYIYNNTLLITPKSVLYQRIWLNLQENKNLNKSNKNDDFGKSFETANNGLLNELIKSKYKRKYSLKTICYFMISNLLPYLSILNRKKISNTYIRNLNKEYLKLFLIYPLYETSPLDYRLVFFFSLQKKLLLENLKTRYIDFIKKKP